MKKKTSNIKSIKEIIEGESLDMQSEAQEVDLDEITVKIKCAMESLGYLEGDKELYEAIAGKIAELANKTARKGLFLCGKNGVGKTFGFEVMQHLTKRFMNPKIFMVNALEIQRAYLAKEVTTAEMAELSEKVYVLEIYNYRTKYPDMIIDDIGSERTVNDFGNKFEIIADLIMYRYEWARKRNCLTHFSTNLIPGEIKERYGERIWSRINEMCDIVFCDGKDWRGKV